MTNVWRALIGVAVGCAIGACGSSSGGGSSDTPDASANDASVVDGATPHDAGTDAADAAPSDASVSDAATSPDASLDAADGDDAADAAQAVDAASDASASALCLGARCRSDQTCGATGCTFPCTGVDVPGDYATIADAVAALDANSGGVICVASGTYPAAQLDGSSITLIGASADKVTLGAVQVSGNVTIKGATLGAVQGNQAATATFIGDRFQAGFYAFSYVGLLTTAITVDGCEFLPFNGDGFGLGVASGATEFTVVVENSYIHGETRGFNISTGVSIAGLFIENNTLVGNTTGILLTAPTVHTTITNNVIDGSTTALDFEDGTADTYSNNARFGNTTNFGGVAAPGTGDVTSDPLLDTSTPPVPMSGSPLIGAGTSAEAPDHDFWGAPRTGRVDIGAVPSP